MEWPINQYEYMDYGLIYIYIYIWILYDFNPPLIQFIHMKSPINFQFGNCPFQVQTSIALSIFRVLVSAGARELETAAGAVKFLDRKGGKPWWLKPGKMVISPLKKTWKMMDKYGQLVI